jgi:hypothetical protein
VLDVMASDRWQLMGMAWQTYVNGPMSVCCDDAIDLPAWVSRILWMRWDPCRINLDVMAECD